MLKEDFIEFVDVCIKRDLPFALYRLPGSDELLLMISYHNAGTYSFSELKNIKKGFVLHPFKESKSNPIRFLKEDVIISSKDIDIPQDVIEEVNSFKLKTDKEVLVFGKQDIEKSVYLSKIENIVERINEGDLNKLVFSKTKTVSPFEKKDLRELFIKMEKRYNDAFVFLVNIPGNFSWCGATPELLLSNSGDIFNTVALAGTQKFQGDHLVDFNWGEKDIEEQAFVCDHIEENLDEADLSFRKSNPTTVRAGGVIHIKTEYVIEGDKERFWDIVEMLHPTPAVCGTPKTIALEVIAETEEHDRSYYSGFLGPIDVLSERRLFVNLRCAKWSDGRLCLYVGGGITSQSVPEKEWEETELKAETLIKLL